MLFSILTLLAREALAAPSPLSIRADQASAEAYASTSDLNYKLSAVDAPVTGAVSTQRGNTSTWSLSIDDTEAGYKQTVSGFGGSVTDATVTVVNALPSDQRSQLLKELLTSDGGNLSLLRHTTAASDLSGPPAYTYDDNNSDADPNLDKFNLGDRGTAMASLLKEIKGIRSDVTIFGSPWSAPGWMRLNRYFVKYREAYAGLGVTIDAITIQNEPLNNQVNGHITMYQTADEAAKVTQDYIGSALNAVGLNTQIWAYDHNTNTPSYPQTVIDTASEYVQATAWHCYGGDLDWTVLTDFHNVNSSKSQYMTECWTSPQTSWYQSSKNTVGPLQNWAECSLMWTLGTWTETSDGTFGPYIEGGCSTCRGLFVVDQNAGTYEHTVDYYMLAQFSKYIPKGATILNSPGSYTYDGYSGVQSVASKNPDGTRTVVVENTFGNDVYLTLNTTSVTTWILP
ncbi:glycoside hydrolase family 30 protein [Jackrogersella minutella]|nr:glycoside hydrolase family 30 protein [Jackrogersella minutella]